jgi:uncharacterized UPF0160 family protein
MSAEAAAKGSNLVIGTHNGHFHADEALAVYMLRMLPAYESSKLVRTRNPKDLEPLDIVVDVGGVYDATKHRYDHHQREFNTTLEGYETKLSSAGLVYKHFGKAILAKELGVKEDDPKVELIYKKVYESFVEAVDAQDNGISKYDEEMLKQAGVKKRYSDGGVTLRSMVDDLNPKWNEPAVSREAEDAKFAEASKLMGNAFVQKVYFYSKVWLPARELVQEAFKSRFTNDPRGRIVVFDRGMPWGSHLYECEEENIDNPENKVLYVLFPEKPESDGPSNWRIRAVSEEENSFTSRKALPEKWRGIRDEELDKISGISGCVFVHASGFIGGVKTKNAAIEMAQKALDE